MASPLPLHGEGTTERRAERAAWSGPPSTRRSQSGAWRGERPTLRPQKRPILELPVEVLSGESEPHDGIAGIAAAVRLCLVRAGGPADAAFASIAQARGTAAAIRLARAYVEIRAGEAGD
jgi:hypothetical protein